MKQAFPLSLPSRGSPARLPVLLLPVLLLAAVAQLSLPHDVALPPAGVVGRGPRTVIAPDAGSVAVPAALINRSLFVPGATAAGDQAPADLLGGAVFAGAVQQGGRRVAVVQTPQGRIRYLAPGGEIAGWRVQQLLPDGVRLARGGTVTTVPYGQHVAPPAPPSQPKDPQE